jgi:integrase
MGRIPKEPRYRPGRDTWYVQVNGRQVTLAKGKANKAAAWKRFREVTARPDAADEAPAVPLVVEVIGDYLNHLARRREAGEIKPQTKDDADRRLAGFPDFVLPDGRRIGDLPADQLTEDHIDAWVDSRRYVPKHRTVARKPKRGRPGAPKATDPKLEPIPPPPPPGPRPLGPTARHDAVGAVITAFRWAKRAKRIAANPIEDVTKPERNLRREAIIDKDQWPTIFAAILSPHFRDLAEFLQQTGARPGEAFRTESRHVDLANGKIVLGAKEHKTGKKTKKARTIYLTVRASEIVGRLCEANPEGPVFRNEDGNAWNRMSVNSQVYRLRQRAGVGSEFVAYALRHLFATNALDEGVGLETLANLMGHANSRMISQVYSHLSERHDHMREAVEKVHGNRAAVTPSAPPDKPPTGSTPGT